MERSIFIKSKLETNYKSHSSKPPWWKDEAAEITSKTRLLEKTLKTNPSIESLNNLEEQENYAKKRLKEIKFEKFKEYTERKLSEEWNSTEVWKTIQKFNSKNSNSYPQANQETVQNMHHFITDFCPPTASNDKSPETENHTNNDINDDLDAPFTLDEQELAVNSLKPNSSPGLDQTNNQMLINMPLILKQTLLHVLNKFFKGHCVPQDWKEFFMVLIPKQGKNKFRPITLASCILKLMEKLIQVRLIHFLESKSVIPESQNGFRKFRSCTTSVSYLIAKIYKAFTELRSHWASN